MRRALAVALALTAATAASAQEPVPAPRSQNLFGSGVATSGHSFAIDWSALGGHDENLTPDHQGTTEPRRAVSGGWGSADLAAHYAYRGRRWNVNVNGLGRQRHYANVGDLSGFDGSVDAALSGTLGRGTGISFRQAAQFQPFYQFNVVTSLTTPDGGMLAPASDTLTVADSRAFTGALGVAQRLGTRSAVGADYGYRHVEIYGNGAASHSAAAGAHFMRAITRRNTLRVGYSYARSDGNLLLTNGTVAASVARSASTAQNVDVGLVHLRPLSASRRTSFSFTAGSSMVNDLGTTQYRLLLNAAASRDLTRAWSGHLDYHRGVTYLDGIAGASYADTVRARFTGLAARRLQVALTAGYSHGQVGLTQSSGGYETYAGALDLRVALSRNLAVVTRYDYYQYFYDDTVVLPPGIDQSLRRGSVRVGITGWLPLF